MKTRDDDYDDGLDLSEAAFKKRFRRVKEEDLPEPVRKLRAAAKQGLKDALQSISTQMSLDASRHWQRRKVSDIKH